MYINYLYIYIYILHNHPEANRWKFQRSSRFWKGIVEIPIFIHIHILSRNMVEPQAAMPWLDDPSTRCPNKFRKVAIVQLAAWATPKGFSNQKTWIGVGGAIYRICLFIVYIIYIIYIVYEKLHVINPNIIFYHIYIYIYISSIVWYSIIIAHVYKYKYNYYYKYK